MILLDYIRYDRLRIVSPSRPQVETPQTSNTDCVDRLVAGLQHVLDPHIFQSAWQEDYQWLNHGKGRIVMVTSQVR